MLQQTLDDNYYYDGLRKSNFYGRFTIDRDNITARKTNSEYIEMKKPRAIQIDQNITRFSTRRNGICQVKFLRNSIEFRIDILRLSIVNIIK